MCIETNMHVLLACKYSLVILDLLCEHHTTCTCCCMVDRTCSLHMVCASSLHMFVQGLHVLSDVLYFVGVQS